MTFAKRLRGAAAFNVAMLIGWGLSVPLAQADFIETLLQQGNNVIATGSGTLDVAGLELNPICSFGFCSTNAGINPIIGTISTGPVNGVLNRFYSGFTGPVSFGSGDLTLPSSGSGDTVAIDGAFEILSVPLDYVSGSALSDNSTYDNQTFGSLGVTPGTYVWTWESGATADSFTLNIVPAPEPSGLALLALPLGLVLLLAARRRRAPRFLGEAPTYSAKVQAIAKNQRATVCHGRIAKPEAALHRPERRCNR